MAQFTLTHTQHCMLKCGSGGSLAHRTLTYLIPAACVVPPKFGVQLSLLALIKHISWKRSHISYSLAETNPLL